MRVLMNLILAIILLAMLASCVTYNKCLDKFKLDTTYEINVSDSITVDLDVPVAGDSVSGKVPCDELKAGDTAKYYSESGKLEAIFWRDRYDSIKHTKGKKPDMNFKSTQKPDTIHYTKEIFVEIPAECPDTVVIDPEKGAPYWHRWLNGYKDFSAVALLLLIVVYIFKRKRNG